jgi:hypothetical protein
VARAIASGACVNTVRDFSNVEPCEDVGKQDWCIVNGNTGARNCVEDEGVQYWTECKQIVGVQGTGGSTPGNPPPNPDPSTGPSTSSTPLLLAFSDEAVAYTRAPGATFDLTGREQSYAFDWPTATTPW